MNRTEANKIMFSVNDYDQDGDEIEKGVFLHFGGTRVKVCSGVRTFPGFLKQIAEIGEEIRVTYMGGGPITPDTEKPTCPKCGSNRQVWKNQITGVLTCHRYGCDNLEIETEDQSK